MTQANAPIVYNPLVMKNRVERQYEVYQEGSKIANNEAVAEGGGMRFNTPTLSKDRYSSKIVDVKSSSLQEGDLDIINSEPVPPTSFPYTSAGGGCVQNSFGETPILPTEPVIEASLVSTLNLIGDIFPETELTAKQRNKVRRWTKHPVRAKVMNRERLEDYRARSRCGEVTDDLESFLLFWDRIVADMTVRRLSLRRGGMLATEFVESAPKAPARVIDSVR